MTQKKAKSIKKDKVLPKKQNTMSELTPQREKFAQLVAEGNTYADAYRGAFKVRVNTKLETIWCESSKLMSIPMVSQRVTEIQTETAKRNQVTLDEVLNEMAIWLKFNVKSIHNKDGTMKQLCDMTDEEASSIAGYECIETYETIDKVKIWTGYLKKVKLLDKRAVADMFLKKFGAYITNMQLNVKDLSHLKGILDGIKETSKKYSK